MHAVLALKAVELQRSVSDGASAFLSAQSMWYSTGILMYLDAWRLCGFGSFLMGRWATAHIALTSSKASRFFAGAHRTVPLATLYDPDPT